MNPRLCSSLVLFIFLHLLQGGVCLTLTELRVPKHVLQGQSAQLVCNYRLRGRNETLYTLKWYKSGHEFYRYVPREVPPIQVFPVPGVYVNLAESNTSVVSLLAVDAETSGRYRCEISAEAPSFDTQSQFSDLLVVVLPSNGPVILGGRQRYRPGDMVKVTCKAAPSRPAQTLAWFINGEHVNTSYLKGPWVSQVGDHLESSQLGLEFRVEARHFRQGLLSLKCSATIATVYWKSQEERLQDEDHEDNRPNEPHSPLSSRAGTERADRVLSSESERAKPLNSFWLMVTLIVVQYGSHHQR